jgi:integrase
MPNFEASLTEAICASANPERREYAIRDTRQRNLSLRVRPGGKKTWIVRQRSTDGSARVSIGQFPETPLKAARMAAAVLTGTFKPIPASVRFAEFCAEHEARHAVGLKPSGLRSYRSYVRTQLIPAFGLMPLSRIGRVDVVRWFERYSATSPGGANRALGILGQMLACAQQWNRVPADWANPVSGVRYNRRRTRGTFLSKAQMARLGTALAFRSKSGCGAALALAALALTGCRTSEVLNLAWGEVLPDRLRLRDSKTGARDVPLGVTARRFFAAHRRASASTSSSALVFPFPHHDGYERVRTVWKTVRRAAELPTTLRIHDLRHSFASHAIMSGETLFTVSRLLGHRRVQTTARYAHLADDTMLESAERIGSLIMEQANRSRRSRPSSAISE